MTGISNSTSLTAPVELVKDSVSSVASNIHDQAVSWNSRIVTILQSKQTQIYALVGGITLSLVYLFYYLLKQAGEIRKLQRENQTLQASTLSERVQILESQIADLRDNRIAGLEATNAGQVVQISELKKTIETKDEEISKLNEEKKELQRSLEQKQKLTSGQAAQIREAQGIFEELKKTRTALEELKNKKDPAQNPEVVSLNSQIHTLHNQIDSLKAELSKTQEELETVKVSSEKEKLRHQKEIDDKNEELRNLLDNELAPLQSNYAELRKNIANINLEKQSIENNKISLEQMNAILKSRVSALEAENENLKQDLAIYAESKEHPQQLPSETPTEPAIHEAPTGAMPLEVLSS